MTIPGESSSESLVSEQKTEKVALSPEAQAAVEEGVTQANELRKQALSSQQADREIALATEKNAFAEVFPGTNETTNIKPIPNFNESTTHIMATGKTPEIPSNITKNLESGKPIDVKKELGNLLNTLGEMLPFLKKIFDGIKKMAKIDSNTDLSKSLKNPEDQKTLDKYAKSEIGSDGKVNMKFEEGTKISKSTQEKGTDTAGKDIPPKTSNIDGDTITLEKDAKISQVIDNNDGKLTLVVEKKDGSKDTYTIATKEKPKTPEGGGETKVA